MLGWVANKEVINLVLDGRMQGIHKQFPDSGALVLCVPWLSCSDGADWVKCFWLASQRKMNSNLLYGLAWESALKEYTILFHMLIKTQKNPLCREETKPDVFMPSIYRVDFEPSWIRKYPIYWQKGMGLQEDSPLEESNLKRQVLRIPAKRWCHTAHESKIKMGLGSKVSEKHEILVSNPALGEGVL